MILKPLQKSSYEKSYSTVGNSFRPVNFSDDIFLEIFFFNGFEQTFFQCLKSTFCQSCTRLPKKRKTYVIKCKILHSEENLDIPVSKKRPYWLFPNMECPVTPAF